MIWSWCTKGGIVQVSHHYATKNSKSNCISKEENLFSFLFFFPTISKITKKKKEKSFLNRKIKWKWFFFHLKYFDTYGREILRSWEDINDKIHMVCAKIQKTGKKNANENKIKIKFKHRNKLKRWKRKIKRKMIQPGTHNPQYNQPTNQPKCVSNTKIFHFYFFKLFLATHT